MGTEFKRLKKGHRPAPMPPTWTHIFSYKPKRHIGDAARDTQQYSNKQILTRIFNTGHAWKTKG